ncbi:MAG: hypothetical protein ABIJ97_03475 [Bacteroidota bacterium]
MKTTNLIIIIILMTILSLSAYSQTDFGNSNNIVRPVQISFISPLGTNGMESGKVANNFSLNMIAGYSGGVEGLEIGGFYNIINGDITGLQIGGFGNTAFGNTDGCQISGFSNINKKNVKGLQIAGFSNIVTDSVTGAQIAGFSNIVNGSTTGLQLAGFSNYSKSISTGAQIAGFSNINKDNAKGIQIAGFSNINAGDLKGVQISGFYNYTKKLTGAQIGFINVCDTVEDGIVLGFLSIVKKGYRAFEISGNETFYGVANFKTGTERFYNIISVGARLHNNEIAWGWGYGLGTMFYVHEKIKLNFDIISYHVNHDAWWTNRLNLLNKVNLTANYRLNEYITIFAGPAWNIHVSDTYYNEGMLTTTSLVSWSSYDRTRNHTNVKMYPGFSCGVRF